MIKTAAYTKNRQQLLELQGMRAEIGYPFDKAGHIIVVTKIVFDLKTPENVYQTMTGVSKTHRGKGLAKLLKAIRIKRLLTHHPDVKVIETDCMLGNEAMISINEKVGFRRKLVPDEKEFILEKLFLHQNEKCI